MPEQHVRQPSEIPTVGRRVALIPVVPAHYPFLYQLQVDPSTNFRWRFRGATPRPDAFESALWEGVLAQFAIVRRNSTELLGLVVAYGADLRNGHVHVGLILAPAYQGLGWPIEAATLFAIYLFTVWPLRKLYADVAGYNYAVFHSGVGRYFREEGRLEQHEFHDGSYWDLHLLALMREDWDKFRPEAPDVHA